MLSVVAILPGLTLVLLLALFLLSAMLMVWFPYCLLSSLPWFVWWVVLYLPTLLGSFPYDVKHGGSPQLDNPGPLWISYPHHHPWSYIMAVFIVPLISFTCLLSMWLVSYFSLVPACWDLRWSHVFHQPISIVPWSTVYSPSSPSGCLFYLALCLPMLACLGPFLVSWELGFLEAAFLPALPLPLLFFSTLPGQWLESSIPQDIHLWPCKYHPLWCSSSSVATIFLDHYFHVSTLLFMLPRIWRCLHIAW